MSDIRYSVIVPAYNAGGTVAECLRALAGQTLPASEYEVIVVDDGSTDATAGIVKTFPVRCLSQPNRGPAAARNLGAREAKGEIILFTDSDCVPDPGWLAEMAKPFVDPGVVAVKGAYRTDQRSLVARFAQVEFEERFELLKKAASIDMIDTYSAAYRKAVFDEAGGFDESFPVANNEDTELSYKLSSLGKKMVFNPRAVVAHQNHPASLVRYGRLKFWRGYWRMVVYRRYPDKMVKDTYTPQTLKFQILFLFLLIGLLPGLALRPGIFGWPAAIAAAAYACTLLPFTLLAFRRDRPVGACALFFLTVRAASLGSGFLWGLLRRESGKTKT
jgi:cellulose synthase/poly-beta-1,6-N-acetylglucosamine synthase-like glycosyltransferase